MHPRHEKTLNALDWPEIIRYLSEQASSPLTVHRIRTLPLLDHPEAVRERLSLVWEGVLILRRSGDLPIRPFPDLNPLFIRAAKGSPLDGTELRAVFDFLDQVRSLRSFLLGQKESAPRLLQWGAALETMEPLRKRIDQSIDEEGRVRESATPALKALIIEATRAREGIIDQLEEMIRSERYEKLLQEPYYTQREERYVLPFKIANQNKEGAVVHDLSASGATAFVEPKELVGANNRLRVAELAVAREIEKILKSLSEEVGTGRSPLQHSLERLVELDLVRAAARMTDRIGGEVPAINAAGRLRLLGARHPLLLLRLSTASPNEGISDVIANDIHLEPDRRALVLSGPNTGGKTVVLKTIGLSALMVRAGLPIPCREGSEIPLFSEVVAEIGDDQDLTRDLSSFSAHLLALISILSHALPGTLVLLDELVTSTDPTEGAALAEAILLEMVDREMRVVTTTHYPSLKGLAQTDPRFLNASLGFDFERLAPTYRLIQGAPGRSAAFEMAARLGLSPSILEKAKRRLKLQEDVMSRLIADLERERQQAEEEKARLAALREAAEQSARRQQEIDARVALSEKEIQKKIRQKVADAVAAARSEISALMESLRPSRNPAEIKKGQERLTEIQNRAEAGARTAPASEIPPEVGNEVEVVALGRIGILLDPPGGAKKVRVQIGSRILSVSSDSVRGVAREEEASGGTRKSESAPAPRPSRSEPELELIGKRVEEALEILERFLDQALLSDEKEIRLIHGHGSGKLKKGIRAYLATSPYVAGFRPGDLLEGGDAVTVVTLKAE